MKKNVLWLWVTKDKYSLIRGVYDTAQECAVSSGRKLSVVRSVASHGKSGKIKNPEFIRLEV